MGDKTPIEFKLRKETATLEIDWKGVCQRFQNEDAPEVVGLSWQFELNGVPHDVLTDYTVWVLLGDTGGKLLCARLEYNSSTDEIRIDRPDKEIDRIADLIMFSEDVRK